MAIVFVDRGGKAHPDTVTLDKKKKDQFVIWVCDDQTKNLFIEFEKDDAFEDMEPKGSRWRVHCEDGVCFSRRIHPTPKHRDYKYWQVLENKNGTPAIPPVDGHIIINP